PRATARFHPLSARVYSLSWRLLLSRYHLPFRITRAVAPRWSVPILIVGLCSAPLTTRPAGLPWGRTLPVPRALLHADGDGDRIYDDLETRMERAAPTAALPVVVLFDVPLEQMDPGALAA